VSVSAPPLPQAECDVAIADSKIQPSKKARGKACREKLYFGAAVFSLASSRGGQALLREKGLKKYRVPLIAAQNATT
jgi:hypothetical protein